LAGKTFDVEVLAGKTSGTGASSFPPTWGLGRRAGGDAKGEGGGSMRLCARDIGRLRIFPHRDHQRSSETAAPLFYRGEKFDGRRRSLVSTQTASACRKYWCAGIPMP